MKNYVLTAKSHSWLLPIVEDALKNGSAQGEDDVLRLARRLRSPGGRLISDDEVLVALNALSDFGLLDRIGSNYRLNKARFDETEELRNGIHAAVTLLTENSPDLTPDVQLCASLPPSLSPIAAKLIHESSADLRSSLLDVIASAKQSLTIASPFWDASTTAEMVSLVSKKLTAGVQVFLLGRFSRDLPGDLKIQLSKIADDSRCSILSWFEGTGNETQTFHFKAISADGGRRGYIGSANMTFSSLRSRMELGVILTGNAAVRLEVILGVVRTMSSPIIM